MCDSRPVGGVSLADWHDRYMPIGSSGQRQLAPQPGEKRFAWSDELLYGRRGALSARRRVARQLAPTVCADWRVPYFAESWGWGDADA